MLTLIVILLITLASLVAVLWAGTFFFQGYIYTEPSPGIFWQAPAAAVLLTFGYTVWCLSVALSTGASTTNIPINTIFRFTPKEDMPLRRPAPNLWAIKLDRRKDAPSKDGEVDAYVSKRIYDKLNSEKFHYIDAVTGKPWHGQGVIAIEIQPTKDDPEKMRFDLLEATEGRFDLVDTKRAGYREFVSKDGWVMTEYEEGPTGLPTRFRWSRFLLNIFFNVGHFVGWFIGFWLLLRFQWLHALGFAVVMWLVATLVLLPLILESSAKVSEARRNPMALNVAFGARAV